MRLLSSSTEDNFELTTFLDESLLPPYAILSHTWANEQEVSYNELTTGTGKEKPGYAKLRFCGERAAEDGLRYFWVDTCCIDKSSSAELTEAINSMFRWYKQAKVCYVYLDDFDLDASPDPTVSGIANCRWFTRGWCLQELLAPEDLRFYERNWRFVGSKKTLRGLVSQITRIGEDILENPSCLHTLPVAKRMSWASARKTTRIEDIAYSLLGIFDVNMPMLYGEGEKAFIRLQEEIIKKSNDLSIFAWTTYDQKNIYQDMFAPLPAYFSKCHDIMDIRPGSRMLSRNLISMTNRGVQFTSIDLSIWKTCANQEDSDYILPLGCFIMKQQNICKKVLFLKKIGPGLFVRVNTRGGMFIEPPELEWPWTIERDLYIVPKVTQDLCHSIESLHESSFEIRTGKSQLTSFSIQGMEPREAWDTPRARFLTAGDPCFVGYLKIYPEMAAGRELEFFVVALGFRILDNKTLEPHICLIQPQIWQRYDAQGRTLAWMIWSAFDEQMSSNTALGRNGTELHLISYKVTVMLQTRNSRGVPVHKVILDWKQHGNPRKRARFEK